MFNVTCLDNKGNSITHLTQWDTNQTLIVDLDSINLTNDNTPNVHFCNKESEKAFVVESTVENNKLSAHIPNALLRVPHKITAYLYLEENNSGKTIYTIEIPVRPRPQPNDFVYSDDLYLISIENILSEVEEIRKNVASEQTELSNLITTIIENEKVRNTDNEERNKVFGEKLIEINNAIGSLDKNKWNLIAYRKLEEAVSGINISLDDAGKEFEYRNIRVLIPKLNLTSDGGNVWVYLVKRNTTNITSNHISFMAATGIPANDSILEMSGEILRNHLWIKSYRRVGTESPTFTVMSRELNRTDEPMYQRVYIQSKFDAGTEIYVYGSN